VPPAFVQASPGATTVLLSQLFDLRALDGPAEDAGEATPDPASVDGAGLLNTIAAPAAAEGAAQPEQHEP